MRKILLLNAFSINMLDINGVGESTELNVRHVSVTEAAAILAGGRVENSIGHPSTAAIVAAEMLRHGVQLHPAERRTVTLGVGQDAVVAQYIGPRLPEGATELPDDARIEWYYVTRTA